MAAQTAGFRSYLSQFLACSVKNLIVFQILQALSFSTVMVTDLLNSESEGMYLKSSEASWFVSLAYLCEPLGSLASGFIIGPYGRKKVMQALNVPMFTAWIMIYLASNVVTLYIASAIFGLSIGCFQAPSANYVGEVSQPKIRGIMGSYAQMFGGLANLFVYSLATTFSWRTTALISSFISLLTFLCLFLIPESPIWLIEKNRLSEAEQSLRWLRGWTHSSTVQEELSEMKNYCVERSVKDKNRNYMSISAWIEMWRHFLRREIRLPLTLVVAYFGASYSSGFLTMQPYISTVFQGLSIPMDISHASVLVSIATILGNVCCTLFIRALGKRALTFVSLLGCSVCTVFLAVLSAQNLSPSWSLTIFLVFAFFTSVGLSPLPWVLQSEVYPLEGKAIATGIGAASSYVIAFAATNTYLNLQSCLGLTGVFSFYSTLSVFPAIYFYFYLPETEGKTFQQIENFFLTK